MLSCLQSQVVEVTHSLINMQLITQSKKKHLNGTLCSVPKVSYTKVPSLGNISPLLSPCGVDGELG